MLKTTRQQTFNPPVLPLALLAACLVGFPASAAPPGPTPVIPVGGGAPGAFPNTSVSAVNVIAKGSTTFDSNVEIAGFDGQGPIPWAISRYNRGDFAMRLAPANPAAADASTLGLGFIDFPGANDAALAYNQSWRPDALLGVIIPTARQNGPINWGDGEGDFYPTVARGQGSSGNGYGMADGTFAQGSLDIQTGRAGTHAASPEANSSFSVTWFPFDGGWIGGNVGNPDATTGEPKWDSANQHAAGLTPRLMTWTEFPVGSGTYGGLGQLRLPGVNAGADGMIFTTSSHGNSDVNIVGVAPTNDPGTGASGWIVTVREDSALTSDEVAVAGQSLFGFVYVPYDARNLIGGQVNGTTGASIHSAGAFTLTRTATGTYEIAIAGKSASSGTLLLQVADFEAGASVAMASRAFLSYQYNSGTGKFIVQCRKTTSDTVSGLTDADFYFAWVDFATPLSPPDGPRLRSQDAVKVTDATLVKAEEGNIAVNTDEPEILVTTVDRNNSGAYKDPTTGLLAVESLIGYFYDPRTLTRTRGPFFIMGNSSGRIQKHDLKYNPVSHQYNVAANARGASTELTDALMIARVNPNSIAGANEPLVKAFIYDGLTNGLSYDDVALAVSTQNGNFIVVAEHKVAGEGEGTYGALFSAAGAVLTPTPTRLDLSPPVGSSDEDDPDVAYLPKKDVFLYVSNTDNDTNNNKIVGSILQTTPSGGSVVVSGLEQRLTVGAGSQGHQASIDNPFNGELITAYDGENNISYNNIGAGPSYIFTPARPEAPYFSGSGGNPFSQNHPQLAADPGSGVILVGHNAVNSSVGYPHAYVFSLLDTNGAFLPSQLGTAYFLADSYNPISGSPNVHNVKYDPFSKSFVAVFTAPDPDGGGLGGGITYVSSVSVTSSLLTPAPQPSLTITLSGANAIVRWPATAIGYTLRETSSLSSPSWPPVVGTPTLVGGQMELTVPVSGNRFYRLQR